LGRDALLAAWSGDPSCLLCGPGRATLFARRAGGWRNLGHVDLSMGSVNVTVRRDGIALLEASSNGCGWPPTQLVALAADGGATTSTSRSPFTSTRHGRSRRSRSRRGAADGGSSG